MGDGVFKLLPGQWTDDTSMALCLGESLIFSAGKMDLCDQIQRYKQWFQNGHLSSNGLCFDIGMTTRSALNSFRLRDKVGRCGPTSKNSAGNGSLMRLAPAPLAAPAAAISPLSREAAVEAARHAAHSSLSTHGAAQAVDSCAFFGWLLAHAVHVPEASQAEKEKLLIDTCGPARLPSASEVNLLDYRGETDAWDSAVLDIVNGSYRSKEVDDIKSTGYVIHSMEAALWCFWNTSSFVEGASLAASLGGDADTVAAIYGQIAGAFYGEESISESWQKKIIFAPLLQAIMDEVYRISAAPEAAGPSEEFTAVHSRYMQLESANEEVIRRTRPCPKMFTKRTEFDDHVRKIAESFRASAMASPDGPYNAISERLLSDFARIWDDERSKLVSREAKQSARSGFLSHITGGR